MASVFHRLRPRCTSVMDPTSRLGSATFMAKNYPLWIAPSTPWPTLQSAAWHRCTNSSADFNWPSMPAMQAFVRRGPGILRIGRRAFFHSIPRMLDTEFHPAKDANFRRLMVVLHGLGDSVAGYRWLPHALGLPWMNYLLVNAPDDYYGGFSWYDFSENPGPGVLRSRRLLFELLDEQRAKGFPTGQTTLSGFSQGCLMT